WVVSGRAEHHSRVLACPAIDDPDRLSRNRFPCAHQPAWRWGNHRPDHCSVRSRSGSWVEYAWRHRRASGPDQAGTVRTGCRGDTRRPQGAVSCRKARSDSSGEGDRPSHRAAGLCLFKKKLFASWDRYMVPYPFSRGLFLYGNPLRVSREADDASLEATRLELETVLNRLTDQAEQNVIR